MKFKRLSICLLISIVLTIKIATGGTVSAAADINSVDTIISNQIINTSNQNLDFKKGKTFIKGKFRYKIISLSGQKGNVSLIGTKSKSIKAVKIPKTVMNNGYTFNITAIGKKAFINCKKLKSVTVNAEIKTIGKKAFYGCKKLKKINFYGKKLKKVGKYAFKKINNNAVIRVPKDKFEEYKTLLDNKVLKSTVRIVTLHTHEYKVLHILVAADCTTQGQQIVKCSCGAVKLCEIPALGHDYSANLIVDSVATCNTEGSMSKHCSRCGSKAYVTVIDRFGHYFTNYVYNNDASCTGDGTETAKCGYCNEIKTRVKTGSALGHDFSDEFTTDIEATCETDGTKSKHCIRCNAKTEVTKIDKLGHSFNNYIYNDDATCVKDGTETATCSRCGKTDTRIKADSALGHSFCDYVYNDDATCTEDGTETGKCVRCNVTDIRTKTGSALGHNFSDEFTNDIEATCETNGTKSKHCVRCDMREEITVIQKLGHDFSNYSYDNNATCTENGTETAMCSKCNKKDTRIKADSALGHSYSNYVYNGDATCTEEGTETGKCIRCNVTETRTKTGSALGHDFSDKFTTDVEATCETDGTKSKHCVRCDLKTEITLIPKLGHEFRNYSYNDDATCVADGTETATCSRCSETDTRTKFGSALGYDAHRFGEWQIIVEAGCTSWGTMARTCSICGEQETESTQPLGHSLSDFVYNNDATCTKDGTETASCIRCNYTDTHTKTGSALGHDYSAEFIVDIEATCTTNGSKSKHCKRCGEKTDVTKISKLGHNFKNYIFNNDAKCTKDGTETASCIRCNYTDTQIKAGSALGHDYSAGFIVDIEATCTTNGSKSKHCKRCGEKTDVTKISKLGHNFENYVFNNDAKCTEDGTETAICSRCGKSDTRISEGTSLGYDSHTFGEWMTAVEAGCTSWGTMARTCSVCGDQETELVQPLGHSLSEFVYNNDATCTKNGTETAKCIRCDYTDTHEIEGSAFGHNIVVKGKKKKASCTEMGYATYSVCENEGCTYALFEGVTDAMGHIWSETDNACTVCGVTAPKENEHWQIIYYADPEICEGEFTSSRSAANEDVEELVDKKYVIYSASGDGTVSVTAPEPKIGYKFTGWSDGVKEKTRTDSWNNMDKTIEANYTYDYSSLYSVLGYDNSSEQGGALNGISLKKPYLMKFINYVDILGLSEKKYNILFPNDFDRRCF